MDMVGRERYFDSGNIDEVSTKFLRSVEPFAREIELSLKKPALVVVDMQKYFLQKESHAFVPSSEAIVSRIKMLQDVFLEMGLPVIHTRHVNSREDAGMMKVWWNDIIEKDDPLSELIEDLVDKRVKVIEKSQYDAFWKTELDEILKRENITDVIICGVMTHLCCETTARSAFVRGYGVIFPVDGTATYNGIFHISTLINLSHGFAIITTVNDILKKLGRRKWKRRS